MQVVVVANAVQRSNKNARWLLCFLRFHYVKRAIVNLQAENGNNQ